MMLGLLGRVFYGGARALVGESRGVKEGKERTNQTPQTKAGQANGYDRVQAGP
jgi:hypothetical protein